MPVRTCSVAISAALKIHFQALAEEQESIDELNKTQEALNNLKEIAAEMAEEDDE